MHNRGNRARTERIQEKLDAGFISKHYPQVKSIVINMIYNQMGIAKPIQRTVNFLPGSSACFRIDCLSRDCNDGGFDLTRVIDGMIRSNSESVKGDLICKSESPPLDHSDIEYDIQIKFS